MKLFAICVLAAIATVGSAINYESQSYQVGAYGSSNSRYDEPIGYGYGDSQYSNQNFGTPAYSSVVPGYNDNNYQLQQNSFQQYPQSYESEYGNTYGNTNGNAYENVNGNSYGNVNENSYGNTNGNAYENVNGNSYGNVNGNSYGNTYGNAFENVNGNSYGNTYGNAYENVNGNPYGNGAYQLTSYDSPNRYGNNDNVNYGNADYSNQYNKNRIIVSRPEPPVVVNQPGVPTININSGPAAVIKTKPVYFKQPPSYFIREEIVNKHPSPVSVSPVFVKVFKPQPNSQTLIPTYNGVS